MHEYIQKEFEIDLHLSDNMNKLWCKHSTPPKIYVEKQSHHNSLTDLSPKEHVHNTTITSPVL